MMLNVSPQHARVGAMDILKHFQFEDVGSRLEDLETPVPVIDIDVVTRNLMRWQARANSLRLASRPHINTNSADRCMAWHSPAIRHFLFHPDASAG